MNRFSNNVSCLLACLVMACAADQTVDPESLGEEPSELSDCETVCDLEVCRRPGSYGYIYGFVQGESCVTHNGQFSVSCDAPNVQCGVCWYPCL